MAIYLHCDKTQLACYNKEEIQLKIDAAEFIFSEH